MLACAAAVHGRLGGRPAVRVLVLGGTGFIGRRVVERLVLRGDDVLVVHRGVTEPVGWVGCRHLHVARTAFAEVSGQARRFAPDAVVDSHALSAADVAAVLPHLPDAALVALSSMDVYRAYEHFRARREGEPVPLDEDAAVRIGRYPYRGEGIGEDDYEKLDVEPPYLARGGSVLRLGFGYGEHDPQRREEFVLRRVRARRRRIPVGAGTLLLTRLYVDDAASAVLAALDNPAAATGEVFNVGETRSRTVRGWAEQILAAAGSDAELVRVPDHLLPADLRITGAGSQHMLASSAKAIARLGWKPTDPAVGIANSVAWHLAHPPEPAEPSFAEDETALAATDTSQ
jgi:nucleoside-diphosphate-sugar epimerase